ncbi:hypothetical protein EP1X_09355 [Thermococcus sp. EP1]|nr:hypothetical protein [Thermococcus sp. EP1]KPU62333.1 hypothetical protein EP1X_09355 [Thermococcus sp. EP1]
MDPKTVLNVSRFIVFLGLVTALVYWRIDHIYRTTVALIGLYIPNLVEKYLKNPPSKIALILSPIYNVNSMAVLGIFIAIHVSLVNVPFTTIDLFHKEWRNADMISHFFGGLVVWLLVTEILMNLTRNGYIGLNKRKLLIYSFVILFMLSIGWEVAEKLSESEISFIHESIGNKVRDIIVNTLGALFGVYLVFRKNYPFKLDWD